MPRIWTADVAQALANIGGVGTLDEIYDAVAAIREAPLPQNWQAIVRKELEYNSSDSQAYQGKRNLFASVDGIGSGVWGLRSTPATRLFFANPNWPARWRDDVRQALVNLGGDAHLSEIYDAVSAIRTQKLPKNWQAIVRKELEYLSSDSKAWKGRDDAYESVEGLGNGVWGLRAPTAAALAQAQKPRRKPTRKPQPE